MPHCHVVKLTLGLGEKNNMVRVRKPYTFVTYGTVRYDGQLKTKLLLLTNGTQTHGILRESPTNDPSKLPQQTLSRLYRRCSRKTYDVKLGASIVDQAAVRNALGARADRQEKKHRLM